MCEQVSAEWQKIHSFEEFIAVWENNKTKWQCCNLNPTAFARMFIWKGHWLGLSTSWHLFLGWCTEFILLLLLRLHSFLWLLHTAHTLYITCYANIASYDWHDAHWLYFCFVLITLLPFYSHASTTLKVTPQ